MWIFFKSNILLFFEVSKIVVVIIVVVIINVVIIRNGSYIFCFVGFLIGMCLKFFLMFYIYNIKKNNKD